MTEIVADKTVEVVKNAIETADGALDLDLPLYFQTPVIT